MQQRGPSAIGKLLLCLATLAGAALVASGVSLAQSTAQGPHVTASVQVTKNPKVARAEVIPSIAVNPVDDRVLAVANLDQRDQQCALAVSTDRGRTWFDLPAPVVQPYTLCTDGGTYGPGVWTGWSPDGKSLYYAWTASDPSEFVDRSRSRSVFFARSQDFGKTWESATVRPAPQAMNRAQYDEQAELNLYASAAIDPNDPNRLYLGWRQAFPRARNLPQAPVVAASTDGGRTWSDPVPVVDEGKSGGFPWLASAPNGEVYALYRETIFPAPAADAQAPPRKVFLARSASRGASWTTTAAFEATGSQSQVPALAADPKSGALYAVLSDFERPSDNRGSFQIHFARSTDGGRTWSDPVFLNDDVGQPGVNHYEPGIAVAPNGRIDVAWYDFRNDAFQVPPDAKRNMARVEPPGQERYMDVYATYSLDGGNTWAPNLRVTDRSIDTTVGTWGNNYDTRSVASVASSNTTAYVAWQDSRNGNPDTQAEDIYIAAIEFGAPAGGGPRLLGLDGTVWAVGGVLFLFGAGGALFVGSRWLRRSAPR